MSYREITAVCSEIRTKHINTLFGQNVEFVNVKSRGQWPHLLRRWSAVARLLGLRVKSRAGAWMSFSCECCV